MNNKKPELYHGRAHARCGTTLKYKGSGNCYNCFKDRKRGTNPIPDRVLEVRDLVEQGLDDDAIAERLGINKRSARAYRGRVREAKKVGLLPDNTAARLLHMAWA